MSTRRSFTLVALLSLLVVLAGMTQAAWSQEVTASIVGTVTDPSGAPLKDAEVVANDAAHGTSLSTRTNESGAYNITRVPIGIYTIKITAAGFQTAVHPAFVLELNQTARIDMQMKVGAVSETVEVTGAAPLLQTERTEVSTIIDARTNEELPLATRNYVQLTLLAPGSVTPNPASFNNGDNTANGGRPYINGNREQANNFILDGIDNNQVSDNLVGFTPAPDAIQEFNLITQNASAEFGNYQGGIVSTTIKSGTNGFHGDLWEFFRPDHYCAGTCSAVQLAARLSRTSCSSFSIIRRKDLIILPPPCRSVFSPPLSAQATFRTSAPRVLLVACATTTPTSFMTP
jgi:hypothetical protein